jgi:hypothetical protein
LLALLLMLHLRVVGASCDSLVIHGFHRDATARHPSPGRRDKLPVETIEPERLTICTPRIEINPSRYITDNECF